MSGLSKEKSQGGKYLNFKEGKIICNKEEFESFTGRIKGLYVEDAEFEDKEYRKITLIVTDDDNKEYLLGFPVSSGYGNAFCCLLPNMNFEKDVTISGGIEKVEGSIKKFAKLFLKQDGKFLKYKWTQKNPGTLPPPEIIKQGTGKKATEIKTYEKRNEFFEDILTRVAVALVKLYGSDFSKPSPVKKETRTAADITAPIDDLPF